MHADAVLFDLDGTLVDSLEDIAAALDAALVEHGQPRPSRATVRSWVGGGARNLVEHAVAPALVDPVLARFRAHYAAAPVVHTRLYPGVDRALDALAAAGTRLAVLSNKPHALTAQIGERLLARWPFGVIAGHRDGMPLKPSPVPALTVARELGVAPERCAFVGDSAIDVETAHAAGMRAVAVTWGYRPRAELAAASPALVIDAPAALAAAVTAPARPA